MSLADENKKKKHCHGETLASPANRTSTLCSNTAWRRRLNQQTDWAHCDWLIGQIVKITHAKWASQIATYERHAAHETHLDVGIRLPQTDLHIVKGRPCYALRS